jgi:hypothetical protein
MLQLLDNQPQTIRPLTMDASRDYELADRGQLPISTVIAFQRMPPRSVTAPTTTLTTHDLTISRALPTPSTGR